MITNILLQKIVNGNINYFQNTINEEDIAQRLGGRIAIDGIEWIFEHKRYELKFNGIEYGGNYIFGKKIFIRYQSPQAKFPAPNNLVIYTPTGEIERILSTPILPTGKQGAGFMQIGDLKGWETIPKGFENWLSVWVWEHERSEWVYQYFFNPDTYEFVFGHKFRN